MGYSYCLRGCWCEVMGEELLVDGLGLGLNSTFGRAEWRESQWSAHLLTGNDDLVGGQTRTE